MLSNELSKIGKFEEYYLKFCIFLYFVCQEVNYDFGLFCGDMRELAEIIASMPDNLKMEIKRIAAARKSKFLKFLQENKGASYLEILTLLLEMFGQDISKRIDGALKNISLNLSVAAFEILESVIYAVTHPFEFIRYHGIPAALALGTAGPMASTALAANSNQVAEYTTLLSTNEGTSMSSKSQNERVVLVVDPRIRKANERNTGFQFVSNTTNLDGISSIKVLQGMLGKENYTKEELFKIIESNNNLAPIREQLHRFITLAFQNNPNGNYLILGYNLSKLEFECTNGAEIVINGEPQGELVMGVVYHDYDGSIRLIVKNLGDTYAIFHEQIHTDTLFSIKVGSETLLYNDDCYFFTEGIAGYYTKKTLGRNIGEYPFATSVTEFIINISDGKLSIEDFKKNGTLAFEDGLKEIFPELSAKITELFNLFSKYDVYNNVKPIKEIIDILFEMCKIKASRNNNFSPFADFTKIFLENSNIYESDYVKYAEEFYDYTFQNKIADAKVGGKEFVRRFLSLKDNSETFYIKNGKIGICFMDSKGNYRIKTDPSVIENNEIIESRYVFKLKEFPEFFILALVEHPGDKSTEHASDLFYDADFLSVALRHDVGLLFSKPIQITENGNNTIIPQIGNANDLVVCYGIDKNLKDVLILYNAITGKILYTNSPNTRLTNIYLNIPFGRLLQHYDFCTTGTLDLRDMSSFADFKETTYGMTYSPNYLTTRDFFNIYIGQNSDKITAENSREIFIDFAFNAKDKMTTEELINYLTEYIDLLKNKGIASPFDLNKIKDAIKIYGDIGINGICFIDRHEFSLYRVLNTDIVDGKPKYDITKLNLSGAEHTELQVSSKEVSFSPFSGYRAARGLFILICNNPQNPNVNDMSRYLSMMPSSLAFEKIKIYANKNLIVDGYADDYKVTIGYDENYNLQYKLTQGDTVIFESGKIVNSPSIPLALSRVIYAIYKFNIKSFDLSLLQKIDLFDLMKVFPNFKVVFKSDSTLSNANYDIMSNTYELPFSIQYISNERFLLSFNDGTTLEVTSLETSNAKLATRRDLNGTYIETRLVSNSNELFDYCIEIISEQYQDTNSSFTSASTYSSGDEELLGVSNLETSTLSAHLTRTRKIKANKNPKYFGLNRVPKNAKYKQSSL